RVLGVRPEIGRTFSKDEDAAGTHVVVLSHRLWRERFGRNPNVLGRAVVLDSKPFLVIGVLPAGFTSYTGGREDFWVTAAVLADPAPGVPKPVSEERGISFLNTIGRLKPGV